MKKLISSLLSLIIFIAVGATGAGFYVNNKSAEMANQNIEMLKQAGFDLSAYESLDIDYFNQSVSLKNLTVASSDQIWFKFNIDEVRLDGINPISDLSVYIEKTQLKDIDLTFYGQVYKITNITATGLKTGYQPHFERILETDNLAQQIKAFHEELDYNSISFAGFELSDNLDNISRIANGSYSKLALVSHLPSQWGAHLSGLQVSAAHLPPQFAHLLREYELKDLNGILDISFNYQTENNSAVFAINNLNFGGMANLQTEILSSMTVEHFEDLYDVKNLEKNLNSMPIEHAEILYNDTGLYDYFVKQQAPKFGLTEDSLRTQIRFGTILGFASITDIEKRVAITTPFTDFIAKPAELKIELSPAKPVRFQHYLNNFDANILVRDLNPTITYRD